MEKVEIKNISADISLTAIQGPKSAEILQSISETDIKSMRYFTASILKLKDINADFYQNCKNWLYGRRWL
ncbi:hypothetical protein ATZ36_08055 [Candidatus Endomicrobiellum trichonymphae]|uniref:Uncharacterized protein n=1 Tax=Endomicrobium trichonymphae TaxID=1408204 RepID=A0A1E5IGR1_ENDTX|nr:hypothetical protein ATZ36_08055 [Candidatus Endomicrobium trichonymphae]